MAKSRSPISFENRFCPEPNTGCWFLREMIKLLVAELSLDEKP